MGDEAPDRGPEVLPPKFTRSGLDSPPERWVSLFGFVIVTKSDLLAAAAFLLSLATVSYQFSSWIRGPEPSVYPPDIVYVFFDNYANNRTIVRLAAQISFVNTAAAGHDAIVRDITLHVSGKDFSLTHAWLTFVTIRRDRTRLLVEPKEAAHPFPVAAGGATSNTVSFAPLEQTCQQVDQRLTRTTSNNTCSPDQYFMTDIEFLNKINNISELHLQFSVRFVGVTKPMIASCTIPTGTAFRQYIAENDWFSVRCISEYTSR